MARFAKGRKGALLYSPITIGILVLAVAFLAQSAWGVYSKKTESAASAAKAMATLTALEAKQKQLEEENRQLETERGVESEIRQKYSVTKPREEVYIIVEGTSTPPVENEGGNGWWEDLKALFSR